MPKQRPPLLTAVTFLIFGCLLGSATEIPRTLSGIVVASNGMPIPGASVEAVQLANNNQDINFAQLQWSHADEDGRFRLNLLPGRYEIRAKDESAGYPDPNFLLSKDPDSEFPVVMVDSQDLSEVTVRLGSKGGVLEGELVDEATKSPIEKGKITIADAEHPAIFVEVFTSKEGRFRFVVPNKGLLISGSAQGHAASGKQRVMLTGGEKRNIMIELRAARTKN